MAIYSGNESSGTANSRRVRIIGDVHAVWNEYMHIAATGGIPSIQVGDFGCGFHTQEDVQKMSLWQAETGHKFIRGNHDDPAEAYGMAGNIKDTAVYGDTMFIGGAWSIDWSMRIAGYDWWPDEELSYAELQDAIEVYAELKPRVMITHDCPTTVSKKMFLDTGRAAFGKMQHKTRTAGAFQAMWELHQPERWYFGHWHVTKDMGAEGTTFSCLGEFDYVDTELNLGSEYGE